MQHAAAMIIAYCTVCSTEHDGAGTGSVALCRQTAYKRLQHKQERSAAGLAVHFCRTEQDVSFILSPTSAAVSHRELASTGTYHDSWRAQGHDKGDAMEFQ